MQISNDYDVIVNNKTLTNIEQKLNTLIELLQNNVNNTENKKKEESIINNKYDQELSKVFLYLCKEAYENNVTKEELYDFMDKNLLKINVNYMDLMDFPNHNNSMLEYMVLRGFVDCVKTILQHPDINVNHISSQLNSHIITHIIKNNYKCMNILKCCELIAQHPNINKNILQDYKKFLYIEYGITQNNNIYNYYKNINEFTKILENNNFPINKENKLIILRGNGSGGISTFLKNMEDLYRWDRKKESYKYLVSNKSYYISSNNDANIIYFTESDSNINLNSEKIKNYLNNYKKRIYILCSNYDVNINYDELTNIEKSNIHTLYFEKCNIEF